MISVEAKWKKEVENELHKRLYYIEEIKAKMKRADTLGNVFAGNVLFTVLCVAGVGGLIYVDRIRAYIIDILSLDVDFLAGVLLRMAIWILALYVLIRAIRVLWRIRESKKIKTWIDELSGVSKRIKECIDKQNSGENDRIMQRIRNGKHLHISSVYNFDEVIEEYRGISDRYEAPENILIELLSVSMYWSASLTLVCALFMLSKDWVCDEIARSLNISTYTIVCIYPAMVLLCYIYIQYKYKKNVLKNREYNLISYVISLFSWIIGCISTYLVCAVIVAMGWLVGVVGVIVSVIVKIIVICLVLYIGGKLFDIF